MDYGVLIKKNSWRKIKQVVNEIPKGEFQGTLEYILKCGPMVYEGGLLSMKSCVSKKNPAVKGPVAEVENLLTDKSKR